MAHWRNWAGNVECRPTRILTPTSVDEVVSAVRSAASLGLPIRIAGAGRSCSPTAATSGVMLASGGLVGVDRVSETEVRVRAGTSLDRLCRDLDAMGLALPAIGDITAQTLAGAVQTGTHGTGQQVASLATGVRACELVLADGEVVTVDPGHDAELFQATRVGLGAFGVVTALTMAVVPAFPLHTRTFTDRFENTVAHFDDWDSDHDMVEFDWYPHTDRTVVRQSDRRPDQIATVGATRGMLDGQLRVTATVGGLARMGRSLPPSVPALNRLAVRMQPKGDAIEPAWRAPRISQRVRFVELEYALPRPMLRPAMTRLTRSIADGPERVTLPVRVRTGPPEEAWLAPGYGRSTVYISLRVFHRSPYQRYFDIAEAIFTELAGRPNWGTAHSLAADRLAGLYPRFDDVRRVRNRVDPERRFDNDYLARVLGD